MSSLNDAVLDAALDYIADNCDRVDICSTEPTTYAEATSTYTLGNYTPTAGAGNGDWTIANGDTSGRKLTLGAQTGNNATGTGTGAYIAGTNGSDTLIFVLDLSASIGVNSGQEFQINAVDVLELPDATNES